MVNVNSSVSNFYLKDKIVVIEGTATANIIYFNDEEDAIQSVQIEIPFILNKEYDYSDCCEVIDVHICLYDEDVIVKKGREIYFDAKIKGIINFKNKCSNELITKVDVFGEIPEKNNAIEIYFAKQGESFWDIGKN